MSIPTLEQLKAQAYDCMANVQVWNNRLAQVNQAITNYAPAPVKPEPTETPAANE